MSPLHYGEIAHHRRHRGEAKHREATFLLRTRPTRHTVIFGTTERVVEIVHEVVVAVAAVVIVVVIFVAVLIDYASVFGEK